MTISVQQERGLPDTATCWALLERVAASAQLRRALRLQELLLYVGRRSLKDGSSKIHEQEIGFKVFGRSENYDTNIDNIVRTNVSDLRKRIEAYFDSEGADETLMMEIPRGNYVPVFRFRPVEASEPVEPTASATTPLTAAVDAFVPRPSPRRFWLLGAVAVSAFVIGCFLTFWVENRTLNRLTAPWKYSPAVAALWSGFLDSGQATDVVMEDSSFLLVQNISRQSFPFNDYLNRTYNGKLQAENLSPEIHSALKLIAGKNLGRASEVRVVQRILALDPLATNLHFYNASEYTPSLALQDNIILFGNPTSNPWIDLFENRLNFTESPDPNHNSAVTNHKPAAGEPAVYAPTDGPDSAQYCAVAYLPNPSQNGKILVIQGTSSEAAEAGGDFLMSEDRLSSLLKLLHVSKLPYFELVLKTSQVTRTPLTTTIEAYRTYPDLH
jgi:hypothetical protein